MLVPTTKCLVYRVHPVDCFCKISSQCKRKISIRFKYDIQAISNLSVLFGGIGDVAMRVRRRSASSYLAAVFGSAKFTRRRSGCPTDLLRAT